MSNVFHDHLDQCQRCRTQPFNLCPDGGRLLRTAAANVVTYIPAMWIHNRAIVREKASGSEFVLRRLRLKESREASTVELLPVSACPEENDAIRLTLDVVERDYESTGKTMSVLRAPL